MSDIYFSNFNEHHLYDGLEEDDICQGESLLLHGQAGNLETLTSCPECYTSEMPIVIICHPHPLHGGSMSNKVVHILAETFTAMGMFSVTFNFRGVGKSQGKFDNGIGETRDLISVCNFFQHRYPQAPIWLAGFSFGAFVALRGHKDVGADRLLLVAPPVTMFDFHSIPSVEVPWMVIQGGKDEITIPDKVAEWLQQQPNRPLVRWMNDSDHFFHGRLNRIRDALMKYWKPLAAEAVS